MPGESLTELIRRELPHLLQEDPALRTWVLDIARQEFAPRQGTEDRFTQLLEEMKAERERQDEKSKRQDEKWKRQDQLWEQEFQKWDEERIRWEQQEEKWQKQEERWQKQEERWQNQEEKWQKNEGRWEQQEERWQRQDEKWEESRKEFDRVHEEIMAQAKKFDRSIGALGSRWGIQSENAFRNALAGILEESFGVEVLNVNEYDDSGEVFGRPDQVELDVIIKNGLLIISELKSSIDKSGMYIFERKARFYEKRHQRKANRLIVISPMIDPKAQMVAEELGIETFSDSTEVRVL